MRLALVPALMALAAGASAQVLEVDTEVTQGGLGRGRTEPDARVALDGRPVRIAPDGQFIFGFGRDAKPTATLEVVFADGERRHRDIHVAQRTYDVRRIDGLPEATVNPDRALLARIQREAAAVATVRAIDSNMRYFEDRLHWPARGPISGVYGSASILNGEPRAPHLGVDVAAPLGTPIAAAAPGRVTLAEPDLVLSGGTVIIDHGYGLSTTYLHMASIAVKPGDDVAVGQTIGTLGATGRVTGPHLHWGLNWYQVKLDPLVVAGPMPPE